jgi:hypothetical protein
VDVRGSVLPWGRCGPLITLNAPIYRCGDGDAVLSLQCVTSCENACACSRFSMELVRARPAGGVVRSYGTSEGRLARPRPVRDTSK